MSKHRPLFRTRPRVITAALLVALLAPVLAVAGPTTPASALGGVFHDPYGNDDLYSVQATERAPRDPMAGDVVHLAATTWPVESG